MAWKKGQRWRHLTVASFSPRRLFTLYIMPLYMHVWTPSISRWCEIHLLFMWRLQLHVHWQSYYIHTDIFSLEQKTWEARATCASQSRAAVFIEEKWRDLFRSFLWTRADWLNWTQEAPSGLGDRIKFLNKLESNSRPIHLKGRMQPKNE